VLDNRDWLASFHPPHHRTTGNRTLLLRHVTISLQLQSVNSAKRELYSVSDVLFGHRYHHHINMC